MPKSKKSDSQRIKEQREKLARMEARAAEKEALANPALKPILDLIENTKKDRLAISRKFSGPQSFQNRIAKHEAWVREIECARELASAHVDNFDNVLETMGRILTEVVNSDDYDIGVALAECKELLDNPVIAEELARQYEAARQERAALTSKKDKEAEAS